MDTRKRSSVRRSSGNQDLPPELWCEILARTPVKSVIISRCVCKIWRSIIDSSHFTCKHLKLLYTDKNRNTTRLLFAESYLEKPFHYKFTVREFDQNFTMVEPLIRFTNRVMFLSNDMIDGILLVDCIAKDFTSNLVLWNPCIRIIMPIPRCPLRTSINNSRYNLGFVPSCGNYKVLAFMLWGVDKPESRIEIAVYSLRDRVWTVKPIWEKVSRWSMDIMATGEGPHKPVYSQGVLYWRPNSQSDSELLCFDLDAEEFKYQKLPGVEGGMLRFLFVLNGSLAVLGISLTKACVWVMGDVLWKEWSSANADKQAYKFLNECHAKVMQVVYIDDAYTLLVRNFRKMMSYNIINHRKQGKPQIKGFCLPILDIYKPSLVLHNEEDAVRAQNMDFDSE